jgi:hypothetical protein
MPAELFKPEYNRKVRSVNLYGNICAKPHELTYHIDFYIKLLNFNIALEGHPFNMRGKHDRMPLILIGNRQNSLTAPERTAIAHYPWPWASFYFSG